MAHVVNLKNPKALLVPQLQTFLDKVVKSNNLLAPGGLNSIAEDLFQFVVRDDHFIVLGLENGEYHSLGMGFFPTNNMFPYPTILTLYNDGSKELLLATERKILDILIDAGYTNAWAWNGSGHADKAWQKFFTLPETEIVRIGGVFEIKVK